MITTNLFLFICRTTIEWILILMVCDVYTGETAISEFGVVIHRELRSDRLSISEDQLYQHRPYIKSELEVPTNTERKKRSKKRQDFIVYPYLRANCINRP